MLQVHFFNRRTAIKDEKNQIHKLSIQILKYEDLLNILSVIWHIWFALISVDLLSGRQVNFVYVFFLANFLL